MAEKNDEVKSYCEKPLDSYREHDLPGKLYDRRLITLLPTALTQPHFQCSPLQFSENVGIVESDTRKERERFNNERYI